MSAKTPFPLDKYAGLEMVEIDEMFVIIKDNVAIGVMNDFPTIDDIGVLAVSEMEELMEQGYIIKDHEEYTMSGNIAVKPFDLNGYPEGSVTIDMLDLIYYKNICIAYRERNHHKIVEATEFMHRLEERGIEYSFMYGCHHEPVKPLTL